MIGKIETINIIESKASRTVSLINLDGEVLIHKKLHTKNKKLIKKFRNEVKVLNSLKKNYVPSVHYYDENFIVLEYIKSKKNNPDVFSSYVNDKIIDNISTQLIDFKTTTGIKGVSSKRNLLINIFKLFIKLWMKRKFHLYHLKFLVLISYLYIKNILLCDQNINTKGDFTELNLLISDKDEVKFIDFDNFSKKGFWLEDASFLFLHQDVSLEKIEWQKRFFKIFLKKLSKINLTFSDQYIRFWFLYSSIILYSIRFFQNIENQTFDSQEKLDIRESRLKLLMNNKKFASFLNEIKIND